MGYVLGKDICHPLKCRYVLGEDPAQQNHVAVQQDVLVLRSQHESVSSQISELDHRRFVRTVINRKPT